MKISINIRSRLNKGKNSNTESLYLDFYPAVLLPGREKPSRRVGLDLYRYLKPKKSEEKEHNRIATQEADLKRARYMSLFEEKSYFTNFERELYAQTQLSQNSFKSFFLDELKKRSGNTQEQWVTTFNYFNSFYPLDLTFADLNTRLVEEFKVFLLNAVSPRTNKKIHQNTALTYFKPFRAALNAALRYGFMTKDLCKQVSDIPTLETKREFLSIDEIKKIMSTECEDDEIKRASIIAIYSGLRHSDMIRLSWKEIVEDSDGLYIELRQKKTLNLVRIPLKDTALVYLGKRGEDESLVFPTLHEKKDYNKIIELWLRKAGIKKYITFHCFRHSFAMMLLKSGVGIYEVSRMLGHTSLSMTQVYLRMLDEDKRKAINMIPI